MNTLKITFVVIGCVVVVVLLIFAIYWLVNRQGAVEDFEVSDPDLKQRVLIASQAAASRMEWWRALLNTQGRELLVSE